MEDFPPSALFRQVKKDAKTTRKHSYFEGGAALAENYIISKRGFFGAVLWRYSFAIWNIEVLLYHCYL